VKCAIDELHSPILRIEPPLKPVGLIVRANSAAVVLEDTKNRWTMLVEQDSGVWSLPSMLALSPHPLAPPPDRGFPPFHLQRLHLLRTAPPESDGGLPKES
jgi:hypothetical protein